jgi:hypothetical protein
MRKDGDRRWRRCAQIFFLAEKSREKPKKSDNGAEGMDTIYKIGRKRRSRNADCGIRYEKTDPGRRKKPTMLNLPDNVEFLLHGRGISGAAGASG